MLEPRLILINLRVKLGVAAAVASALVRSVEFKSLLFREERSAKQKIYLVLWIGIPLAPGCLDPVQRTQFPGWRSLLRNRTDPQGHWWPFLRHGGRCPGSFTCGSSRRVGHSPVYGPLRLRCRTTAQLRYRQRR